MLNNDKQDKIVEREKQNKTPADNGFAQAGAFVPLHFYKLMDIETLQNKNLIIRKSIQLYDKIPITIPGRKKSGG